MALFYIAMLCIGWVVIMALDGIAAAVRRLAKAMEDQHAPNQT